MTAFDITDAFLERLVQRGIVCMAWTQVYDPAGSVALQNPQESHKDSRPPAD